MHIHLDKCDSNVMKQVMQKLNWGKCLPTESLVGSTCTWSLTYDINSINAVAKKQMFALFYGKLIFILYILNWKKLGIPFLNLKPDSIILLVRLRWVLSPRCQRWMCLVLHVEVEADVGACATVWSRCQETPVQATGHLSPAASPRG